MVGPYIFAQRTPRGRLFWSLVFIGALALLVGSRSKTSEAILAICLALLPVVLLVLSVRTQALRAICAGLALALVAALFLWIGWCTLTNLDPLSPLDGVTLSKRTDVWAFVIGEIAKRPLQGAGFGSFWDIDPALQPSIHSGLWFTQGNAFTNEAHNGYLDLLVTTGFVGLLGALFVLLLWVGRGLAFLRWSLRSPDPGARLERPAAVSLGLFPLIIFSHNFTESSYFTANAIFGTLVLLMGVNLDLRRDPASAQP
jgi:O-antigen ligase